MQSKSVSSSSDSLRDFRCGECHGREFYIGRTVGDVQDKQAMCRPCFDASVVVSLAKQQTLYRRIKCPSLWTKDVQLARHRECDKVGLEVDIELHEETL